MSVDREDRERGFVGSPYLEGRTPVVPSDAAARKALPVCAGVLDYFPDALLEVARVSLVGSEQHSPGEPLHWAKEKSTDEADALLRHLIDRGTRDQDGVRHSAKVAWRALALLQRELDAEKPTPAVPAPPQEPLRYIFPTEPPPHGPTIWLWDPRTAPR